MTVNVPYKEPITTDKGVVSRVWHKWFIALGTSGTNYTVEAGITAGTTQTQGQVPLTKNLNEVSTVANDDDVVTMPAAAAGEFVIITNNGANDLQIFPASGDNFEGVAANASITLKPESQNAGGTNSIFYAQDGDVWQQINSITTGYGSSASLLGTVINPIAYWGGVGTGGSTNTTTKLLSPDQINPGLIQVINETASTLTMWNSLSDGAKTLTFYIANLSTDSAANVVLHVGAGAAGGDCSIRWTNAGNSDDNLQLGRDRSEGADTLKLSYGTDLSSGSPLFRMNVLTGVFSLEAPTGYTGSKFVNYGLGTSKDANTEYIEMYHNGTNAVIDSDATGSGAVTDLILATGGTPKLTIVNSTGNVGVNVIDPDTKVEILDGAATQLKLSYDGTYYTTFGTGATGDQTITPSGTQLLVGNGCFVRATTAIYRRYYHLPLAAFSPGASGATWTSATSDYLCGWQLNAVGETLEMNTDVHADWDAASDLDVEVTFTCMTDNSGGGAGDTVDLKLVLYYKAAGDIVCKTQTIEDAIVVGACAQYTQFKHEFTINFDETDNVVEVGDVMCIMMNLETDTSEVDDVLINDASFYYHTTHTGIESGDT